MTATIRGVADVFTGRSCRACGWNERTRNAGDECAVCGSPMVDPLEGSTREVLTALDVIDTPEGKQEP